MDFAKESKTLDAFQAQVKAELGDFEFPDEFTEEIFTVIERVRQAESK